MRDDKLPTTSNENEPVHGRGGGRVRQMGLLGGPQVLRGGAGYLYGLDFQLDSGHGPNPDDDEADAGSLRVYEMDYVPPGRAAMRLAKIYVTGNLPCHIMDRARGMWLLFDAATEYWYLNNDALVTLVATAGNGKLLFRIAHERCRSGATLDEIVWSDVPMVVEQVAPRDVAWRTNDAKEDWPAQAYLFSLSDATPTHVGARQGCLLSLRLAVTAVNGGDGRPIYRIASTEWGQGAGQGALFAGWRAGEGVMLERADTMPADIEHIARCALDMASGSKLMA